jgi:hypothetical protein
MALNARVSELALDVDRRSPFKAWLEDDVFASVSLGPLGEISWGEAIDLCPDAVYMRLTRKTPEQVFPNLKKTEVDA